MQRDTSSVLSKSVLSSGCKKAISLNPDVAESSKTMGKGPAGPLHRNSSIPHRVRFMQYGI